ncbi:MAG: hypothetical protein Q9171_007578, partial [Xanthocarpia ochracea]
ELVGYWARAYSTKKLEDFTSYSISQLLIMLGPSVLAAGLYQAFGRLLYYTVPPSHRTFRTLFMPARFIAPVFVVLDVVAFFIQLIGLGIALQSINKDEEDKTQEDKDAQKRGVDILRVGLIVQLLVFGVFAVLCMRIVLISKRWQFAWPDAGKWRDLGWIVATGSFLITFRALYRIFEFTINNGDNYFATHEWTAYVFDAVPMVVFVVLFSLYHPSKYLPPTHMSLNHAYKRLGNSGSKTSGPRYDGVELGHRTPNVVVQPAAGNDWVPPRQEHMSTLEVQGTWANPPRQEFDRQNERVYLPYRSRSPSPNPQERLIY